MAPKAATKELTLKTKKAHDRRERRQAAKAGVTLPPRKRGNPGNFSGERLAFLEKAEGDYVEATSGARGAVGVFLDRFMHGWWKQFPWYEGLDPQDPLGSLGSKKGCAQAAAARSTSPSANPSATASGPTPNSYGSSPDAPDAPTTAADTLDAPTTTSDPPDPPTTTLDAPTTTPDAPTTTPDAPGALITTPDAPPDDDNGGDEDEFTEGVDPAWKGEVQTIIAGRVKGWFAHRKTVANRSNKNPFTNWLKGFQRTPAAPRRLPLHKFYMAQDEYVEKVDKLFQKEWPKQNQEERFELDFRCKCAKTLLSEEPKEVQKALATKCEEQYKAEVTQHENQAEAVANPDELDAEAQAECRKNIAQVVQPFLDGMAKLTGYHVTLLAGAGPPEGSVKYSLTTLHAGRTYVPGIGREGLKFDQWQPDTFKKNVMGHFMRFLLETNEHSATSYTIDQNEDGVRGSGGDDGKPRDDDNEMHEDGGGGEDGGGNEDGGGDKDGDKDGGGDEDVARGRKKGKGKGRSTRKRRRETTPEETPSPSRSRSSRSKTTPPRTPSPFRWDVDHIWGNYDKTPVLPSTHIPSQALIDEVAALPTPQRRARMARLATLGEYEFTGISNRIRNKALIRALRADSPEGLFDDLRPTLEKGPPKKKRKTDVPTVRRKSARLAVGDIAPLLLPEGANGADKGADQGETGGTNEGETGGTNEGEEGGSEGAGGGAKTPDGEGAGGGAKKPDGEGAGGGAKTPDAEGAGGGAETPDGVGAGGGATETQDGVGAGGGATETQDGAGADAQDGGQGGKRAQEAGDKRAQEAGDKRAQEAGDKRTQKAGEKEAEGRGGANEGVLRDGWGKWMNDGFEVLQGCAGGKGWSEAVQRWTELERAYGFATSSKALPTTGRPAAVHAWTKGGRRPNKPPTVELETFVPDWWAWWGALAPAWREKDALGRPKPGNSGPWGILVHPGANGILMVLLALAWWRNEEESASEGWLAAVRDVGWVLDGLLAEARKRPAPEDADEAPARPAKRARRA